VRAIFANSKSNPAAIVAELKGIDTAICAGKVTVSPTPVFDLCRELITEGFPPEMPLVAYRDGKLAFSIRSIGEAAKLEIGARGNAFIRRGERRIASLVRKNGQADIKGQGANGRISGAVRQ